ncbi:MAG: hypothetical protein O3B37_01005 [Proteobacteria bacterium]|nr:hypothetical protein [Pseudomonadota bacterium]
MIGSPVGRRLRTVHKAGLVEVDMGLDQPAGDEPAGHIEALTPVGQPGLDGRDSAPGNPDILQRRIRVTTDNSRIAQHQIQTHKPFLLHS